MMGFGRVRSTDLDTINFSLPAGDDSILPGTPASDFKFYFGSGTWGREAWVGTLYPKKTKGGNFLDEYLNHFNYLELNATFYQMPTPDSIRSWAAKMNYHPGFKCTPRVSRQITHLKSLKNAKDETDDYIDTIALLGDSLGPCFFQLSDHFSYKYYDILEDYLKSLPENFKCNIELRHESWFEDQAFAKLQYLLKDLDIGLLITDSAGRRDLVHMYLITNSAHIRFNGYSNHPTDRLRLQAWRDRIIIWKEKGIKDIYFALDQHESEAFYESQLTAREIFKDLTI